MLTIKQFGKLLLYTEDLDPVYTMLTRTRLDRDVLERWCLAYWMFYHVGVASQLASRSSKSFFDAAIEKVKVGAPRGRPRRHFRGHKAVAALEYLKRISHNRPEYIVGFIFGNSNNRKARPIIGDPMSFSEVAERVESLPQFGYWASFKIADMGERVLGYRIDFRDCELAMYKDPMQASALIIYGNPKKKPKPKDVKLAVKKVLSYFPDFKAPPARDRPLGLQEAETILCKYLSYTKGHYPTGKIWKEIRDALAASGKLAKRLRDTLPEWETQLKKTTPRSLRKIL